MGSGANPFFDSKKLTDKQRSSLVVPGKGNDYPSFSSPDAVAVSQHRLAITSSTRGLIGHFLRRGFQ
jgi:hypothetical protein